MTQHGFRSMLAFIGAGFQPRGVVMGALALQLYQPACMRRMAGETEPLVFERYEQALRDAWREVIGRLEREASKSDAHGVVGVSVRANPDSGLAAGGAGVREFRLVGTRVVVPGAPPLRRPFISMLSMDDTLKLLLGGWVPTGIAIGISAVHVHGWAASPMRQRKALANAEMEAPTAGVALARARAESEARRSLLGTHAEGIVAARLDVTQSAQPCGGGQGLLLEGTLVGTGVVRYRDPVLAPSAVRNLTGTGAP